jgi:aspartate/methionine/tyrosine aminotransferase
VPVYYDLKEGNQWEPDFEALEKLDLTKKIMWIGYPTCQQELEGV